MKQGISESLLKEFIAIVGEKNISVDSDSKLLHSKDKSFHTPHQPDLIIWPQNTREVSKILALANKHQVPITARGGGSSLEGNPIPVNGGIVLDMTRMNKVLQIFPEDLAVRVQPGIIGEQLDKILLPYQLWFAVAPGSKHLATIGGMIANNSGGMHTVKYGVVADAVLELEVVLANGEVIRVGSRSFKSSSGYHLKHLFIGSEGTLGIITEAILKLTPLPETKVAILTSFYTSTDAAVTAHMLLLSGVNPAAIEYMDGAFISLANQGTGKTFPKQPTLIIELHGEKSMLSKQLKTIKNICLKNNSGGYHTYTTAEQLATIWGYRRAGRPTMAKVFPQMGVLSAEVGVPLSQIPKLLKKAEQLEKKYRVQTVMFGHMGDGNFHGWALYELGNKKAWGKVNKLNEELILFALKVGGTTSGEHGLGIGKRKFLPIEHPTDLPLMKEIKKLLDPKSILNPGKIFLD